MVLHFPEGIPRRWATVAYVLLACIWLWVAFDRPYRIPEHALWNIYSGSPLYSPSAPSAAPKLPANAEPPVLDIIDTPPQSPTPLDSLDFPPTQAALDVFDYPPLDSSAIRSICHQTKWNESVVFTCNESVGGIGNIRNSILNCVRYAISAGGSLVVPRIVQRNEDNISEIRTGVTTDLSYMFDTQHFVDSLALSCPGLRIYPTINDVGNSDENANEPIPLLPENLAPQPIPRTGIEKPEAWRGKFYAWLQRQPHSTPASNGNPVIVKLGRTYISYPIYSDGEQFALAFGKILKLRSDTRYLATKVLLNLAEQYEIDMNPSLPTIPSAFFGAHLRTEKDAAEGWPVGYWNFSRFEVQSQLYLDQTAREETSVIYVASGDLHEVEKFAVAAATIDMSVTTKTALLESDDLELLQSLAWDQQALVDFMVMTKASDFAGVGHSSFAWNVALKRHIFAKERNHLNGSQLLYDELSVVYGQPLSYPEYAACLWP